MTLNINNLKQLTDNTTYTKLYDLYKKSQDTNWNEIITKIELPDFDDTQLAIIKLDEYVNYLQTENDDYLEDSLGGLAYFSNLKNEAFDPQHLHIYGWLQIMPYALLIHDNEMCQLVPLIKTEFQALNSVNWITLDDESSIHNWLTKMEKLLPDISNLETCMEIDIDEAVPVIDNSNNLIIKHN